MNGVRTERALVTGAAGFIGSHVAEHCLELGFETVAVDDLSGGFRENVPADAVWEEGDVRDAGFVRGVFERHAPIDYVYHLAAYAAEGLSHFVRAYNYRTNLEATVNLVNEAVRGQAKRFVFASSIAVYGAGQVPMHESLEPRPEDPYGISKYAAELDLAAAAEMFGLRYTVFRPHNVYGERQNVADPYRNVVGIFMSAGLRGESMPVFGDGSQTRAFSHIGDVAPVIARSVGIDGTVNETFNIGADTPVSVARLAELVAEALGVPHRVEHLPERREVAHAFADHSKVRAIFGLGEPLGLEEGLTRMAAWVRETGLRDPVGFPGEFEIRENMPPSWDPGRPSGERRG